MNHNRVATLAFVLCAGCGAGAPTPPLDVVLISIDTLRADRVGAYGYPGDTTPEIDGFFAGGTVFEQAVSSAPCTIPAVAQLLTGSVLVEERTPTLAELLRERGYRTHAVVSQHMFRPAAQPREAGSRVASQIPRGFESFDIQEPGQVDRHGFSTRPAREVADRAIAWLGQAPADAPFFLWLHFFDPHDPYAPPAAYADLDAGSPSLRGGDRRQYLMDERSEGERWQRAGHVFTDADVEHLRNLYDGEIRYADAEIGRVLAALEAAGRLERSLVVLVADHGEWLGENGRWDHCQTLREPEVHVPLMLRLRGEPLGADARVAARVSNLDVVPTVLRLLGFAPEGLTLDGIDLGAPSEAPRVLSAWGSQTSAYAGDWKLVLNRRRQKLSLHDLALDAGETRDVGAARPDVLAELRAAIEAAGPRQWAAESQNDDVHEQLRELGYLE